MTWGSGLAPGPRARPRSSSTASAARCPIRGTRTRRFGSTAIFRSATANFRGTPSSRIMAARAWELLEVVKKKLGTAFSPETRAAGVVLTGGTAKLPGLAGGVRREGLRGACPPRRGAPRWVAENLRDPGYHTALGLLSLRHHGPRRARMPPVRHGAAAGFLQQRRHPAFLPFMNLNRNSAREPPARTRPQCRDSASIGVGWRRLQRRRPAENGEPRPSPARGHQHRPPGAFQFACPGQGPDRHERDARARRGRRSRVGTRGGGGRPRQDRGAGQELRPGLPLRRGAAARGIWGGGAAPIVAEIAAEQGALVIAFVTLPFSFEGGRRLKQAEDGLRALRQVCDAVIPLPNDVLLQEGGGESETVLDSFARADAWVGPRGEVDLGDAVEDRADQPRLRDHPAGLSSSGGKDAVRPGGRARAKTRWREAIASLETSGPLLHTPEFSRKADRLLVNIVGGTDLTLPKVNEIMSAIAEQFGRDSNIGDGRGHRRGAAKNRVEVCVLGTSDMGGRIAPRRPAPRGKAAAPPARAEAELPRRPAPRRRRPRQRGATWRPDERGARRGIPAGVYRFPCAHEREVQARPPRTNLASARSKAADTSKTTDRNLHVRPGSSTSRPTSTPGNQDPALT